MSLFTVDGLTGLIFLFVVASTITGAIIATSAVSLIRSVIGLALCLIGVAGLYYFLNSPFIALMQILIYVGAVCVTIIFAIMMAEPHPEKQPQKQSIFTGVIGLSLMALLLWGLAVLSGMTIWPVHECLNPGELAAVGKSLLTNYSMVFELISLVLMVAIIGSLVLARPGRGKNNA